MGQIAQKRFVLGIGRSGKKPHCWTTLSSLTKTSWHYPSWHLKNLTLEKNEYSNKRKDLHQIQIHSISFITKTCFKSYIKSYPEIKNIFLNCENLFMSGYGHWIWCFINCLFRFMHYITSNIIREIKMSFLNNLHIPMTKLVHYVLAH